AADRAAQALAGPRVDRVEKLVEVDRGARLVDPYPPPVRDLRAAGAGRHLEVDEAVRDPRLGELADDRPGAGAQRLELPVRDLQVDERLAVVRDPDVGDVADRYAGDLDVVALHELAGVQELGGDRVAAAPHEQDQADER